MIGREMNDRGTAAGVNAIVVLSAALMAGVEAKILPGVDVDFSVAGSASRYDPDMANHERYCAGRDRQARLEQALVLTGEFV